LRKGTTTTVKVNGTTIFDHVEQGKLGSGNVGVATHWSKGNSTMCSFGTIRSGRDRV
jgi:hypothetical protein